MAVVQVTELFRERQGNTSASNGKTATRLFHVLTDDVNDGVGVVEAADGLPPIGEALAGDPDPPRKCSNYTSTQVDESNVLWLVRVDYEYKPTTNDPGGDNGGIDISWDFEESQEPIFVDGNGNAILNSAGQSFDPPIDDIISDLVLTITRPEFSFDVARAVSFKDAVDFGFLASNGHAKMRGISGRRGIVGGFNLWLVTYRIVFREFNPTDGRFGWNRLILDEGKIQVAAVDPGGGIVQVAPILDASGQQVSNPVKLNGQGVPISTQNPPSATEPFIVSTDGQSVFRVVQPKKLRSFSTLGLPIS